LVDGPLQVKPSLQRDGIPRDGKKRLCKTGMGGKKIKLGQGVNLTKKVIIPSQKRRLMVMELARCLSLMTISRGMAERGGESIFLRPESLTRRFLPLHSKLGGSIINSIPGPVLQGGAGSGVSKIQGEGKTTEVRTMKSRGQPSRFQKTKHFLKRLSWPRK